MPNVNLNKLALPIGLVFRTKNSENNLKDLKMLRFKYLLIFLPMFFMLNAHAGIELVCKGASASANHKTVYVDCENRKAFVDMLGAAWQELRKNSIGGAMEDMCWKAYNQAKDMHPSISFANISDSFLMRCNMGLAYIK